MSDEEARAKLLASMGIKRRSGAAADDEADDASPGATADDPDADDGGMAPAEPEPRPAAAATAEPEAPKKDARAGLGLGSRRAKPDAAPQRGEDGAPAKAGDAAKKDEQKAADAPAGEKAPPTVRLGNDECATLLANYFKVRPNMREVYEKTLPRLFELKRTHGRYIGDGRPERKLWVGFEPAYVLFTIPAFLPLEGHQPTVEKSSGAVVWPDAFNPQPRFVQDGFIVTEQDPNGDPLYNKLGDWYLYVVFRSDGQPLDLDEAAERAQKKKPAKKAAKGLGVKRRK